MRPIIVITFILLVFNLVAVSFYDYPIFRITRIITLAVYLGVLIYHKSYNKHKYLFAAFVLLFVSEFGMLYYEEKWFCFLKLIASMLGYTLIIAHLLKNVKLQKIGFIDIAMLLVLLTSNFYMLFYLLEIAKSKMHGTTNEILVAIYGIVIITLVFLANYLHSLSTKNSIYILGFSVAFIATDILEIIAFYLEVYSMYYPERFTQLTALTLLVLYTTHLLDSNKEDEFSKAI